jgi:hypothetical protein
LKHLNKLIAISLDVPEKTVTCVAGEEGAAINVLYGTNLFNSDCGLLDDAAGSKLRKSSQGVSFAFLTEHKA